MVPVLSLSNTVISPLVSADESIRTNMSRSSILRTEKANAKVMASGSPYDVKNTHAESVQPRERARVSMRGKKKSPIHFSEGSRQIQYYRQRKSEIICESFIIEMDGGEKESRSNQCLRGKSADSVLSSEKSEIICESFIIDTERATRRKNEKARHVFIGVPLVWRRRQP